VERKDLISYLAYFDARLVAAASRAEHVLALDPVGALNHLRYFGEILAQHLAARLDAQVGEGEPQVERLRALGRRGVDRQAGHGCEVRGARSAAATPTSRSTGAHAPARGSSTADRGASRSADP
jgi:hypothetical protein